MVHHPDTVLGAEQVLPGVVVARPDIIAVDGPVASGKSTVGRLLAHKLAFRFLDTGSMYRAIALATLQAGVSARDSARVMRLAQEHPIEMEFQEDGQAVVLIDGRDVTSQLRDPQVEDRVSLTAQIPEVRDILVVRQRHMAKEGQIVMAGRDIGTVVLPDATLKVFLTASVEERAHRRHAELEALGQESPYPRVLGEMIKRDQLDSQRKVAPLKPASDARIVATDGLSVEEVVEGILNLWKQRP